VADIFLSYAREDLAWASQLAAALAEHNWSVFWDRRIPTGRSFDQLIEQELEDARCVIVLWSRHSIASDWVKAEASEGARRGVLRPIWIEDVRIPLEFRRLQTARLVDWQRGAAHREFDQLLSDIGGTLGPRAMAPGRTAESPAPGSGATTGIDSSPLEPVNAGPGSADADAEQAFSIVGRSGTCAAPASIPFKPPPIETARGHPGEGVAKTAPVSIAMTPTELHADDPDRVPSSGQSSIHATGGSSWDPDARPTPLEQAGARAVTAQTTIARAGTRYKLTASAMRLTLAAIATVVVLSMAISIAMSVRRQATQIPAGDGARGPAASLASTTAADDPTTLYAKAQQYADGRGVERDYAKAAKLYRQAADLGHAKAQVGLGTLHATGRGVPRDDAEAVRWFRKAADQGEAAAQSYLGFMYETGQGVPNDGAEAVRWYRKAADQGDAVAQKRLGSMYDEGRGVPKDEAEAVKWYRKAADRGLAAAQMVLGLSYDQGRGVLKDEVEAVKWYRKAADQGFALAQTLMGVRYASGKGVPRDDVQAVMWFRRAADQGEAAGQNHLGLMSATGRGVPRDDSEAISWYRKAADQGNAEAQFNLGRMYATGRGVPRDNAEAVRRYRKAADQGAAVAQNLLGVIHSEGDGVPRDEAEAVRWFRKAADQGYVAAQTNLAVMYADGRGVPRDDPQAVKWYRQAARQGDKQAQEALRKRGVSW
jgi:TPR repeat protein